MQHINQVVSGLGVQRDEIVAVCTLLELKVVDGDKLPPETVNVLNNVKAVAEKGGISFMEAAQHVADMRNGERGAQQGNRFSKREYIKQRFGVDPEAAAPGSFIWMLYQDVNTQSEQLGEVRFQTIIEASSHVLRDRLMNGHPEEANNQGFEEANNRVSENITSFLGNVNWGELPQLMGSSTQPTKQLQAMSASTSKTPTSAKKSSDK